MGRRSGTIYRTPVLPRRIPDGYEIPLPYGADAHWVQNVLAAGHARLQAHETIHELVEPRVIGASETLSLTRYERWRGAKLGYQYLRVRQKAEMPGTFTRLAGHEPALTHGERITMPMEEVPATTESLAGGDTAMAGSESVTAASAAQVRRGGRGARGTAAQEPSSVG